MDPHAASEHARSLGHLDPAAVVPVPWSGALAAEGDPVITRYGRGTVVRAWPAFTHTNLDVPRGTVRVPRLFVRLDGAEPGRDCVLVPADEALPLTAEPEPEPVDDH